MQTVITILLAIIAATLLFGRVAVQSVIAMLVVGAIVLAVVLGIGYAIYRHFDDIMAIIFLFALIGGLWGGLRMLEGTAFMRAIDRGLAYQRQPKP